MLVSCWPTLNQPAFLKQSMSYVCWRIQSLKKKIEIDVACFYTFETSGKSIYRILKWQINLMRISGYLYVRWKKLTISFWKRILLDITLSEPRIAFSLLIAPAETKGRRTGTWYDFRIKGPLWERHCAAAILFQPIQRHPRIICGLCPQSYAVFTMYDVLLCTIKFRYVLHRRAKPNCSICPLYK